MVAAAQEQVHGAAILQKPGLDGGSPAGLLVDSSGFPFTTASKVPRNANWLMSCHPRVVAALSITMMVSGQPAPAPRPAPPQPHL